jgi:predicted RNA binding protein YcfA (HicA-like mRNA interferase family)
MSQEKLIKKFLGDRFHITVEDCDRLLTAFGYNLNKSSGSHMVYHKRGMNPITIISPKKSKYTISPYVNKLVNDLGLEALDDKRP